MNRIVKNIRKNSWSEVNIFKNYTTKTDCEASEEVWTNYELFGDAVDGDSADICAEKKVKTPKKDNEYTMHTI